jgi:hypothetical protein
LHRLLKYTRCNGTFQVHYVAGWNGRWGKPVPFVYTEETLDPAMKGKVAVDPILGAAWAYHAQALPDDFSHVLVRWPVYKSQRGRERFLGWHWVCPMCGRKTRVLFYPMGHADWASYVGFEPGRQAEAPPAPSPRFGCNHCHRPACFSRAGLMISWNRLILQMSGGLLYGHEVRLPAWLKDGVRLKRRQPPRISDDELYRILTETVMPLQQLGRQLRVTRQALGHVARRLFRQHGVRNRAELRKQHEFRQPRPAVPETPAAPRPAAGQAAA